MPVRNDPSETGGLFIGRRPGTAPVHYRTPPRRASNHRRRVDGMLANVLLTVMALASVVCWGPLPVACLWIGSRILYVTGDTGIALLAAFASMLAVLLGALALMTRIDDLWILFRRAAGNDQRSGAFGRIFGITALVCTLVFAFWFVVIHGPGSQVFPGNKAEIE